ncbi:MAG: mono/diheme cytochrome c family protein [Gammaproteobacteria bacterium]|jgi:mono/diheme cytochrome c family protein
MAETDAEQKAMSARIVFFTLVLCADNSWADSAPGEAVFRQQCTHCHGAQASAPGRLKLEWTRGIENSVLSERLDLNADSIRRIVRRGQAAMPSFRKTEISDIELDALVGYLNRHSESVDAP